MQLLVLRHAKSSWADRHADDWERPLTERGERDASRVGDLLRRLRLVPDLIITSDAVRAQTTAQRAAAAAGYAGKLSLSPRLYHATPDAVIEVLHEAASTSPHTLMIVGHNPGLEDLVEQLTGAHVGLSTATLVQIELPVQRWDEVGLPGTGTLRASWHPDEM
ncbi:MAG TPA: histidine phosphatase family protein [Vicinamibacterales bacterium]